MADTVLLIIALGLLYLWWKERKDRRQESNDLRAQLLDATSDNLRLTDENRSLAARVQELFKYQNVADAEAEAKKILDEAHKNAAEIKSAAEEDVKKAKQRSGDMDAAATDHLRRADEDAARIIAEATEKARQIAGSALEDKEKAEEYRRTAEAIRHVIDGYGDEWVKPAYSILDDLAEDFGYTEAGIELKRARLHSAEMVKDRRAATCDYVETIRRMTAIAFVVDAFNGKVDSILSKVKHDNYGKLEQAIKDAFSLVNANGAAFRNARITEEYLSSRLEELRWAVAVNELKKREQEQQRLIREQMREEERARREYEKAMKDAAKEEAMLSKAMEKAKAMLAQASAEQRAKYEAQVSDLETRLKEAEERNQRALSMAQQTRRGNVYVISNIGSFGENVYKVGMTRRLDPMDRIRELGDASVPFPFDVHAVIESEDAPALENALHKDLAMMQMNKVNPRKEFFKVSLADVKALVEKRGIQAAWTMTAAAAEYKESLAIERQIAKDAGAKARWESYAAAAVDESTATTDEAL